jgi:uncharacterized delta-60 repeat protein
MKRTENFKKDFLKGFSTLEAAGRKIKPILLFMLVTILTCAAYGGRGHSILDLIDPSFNVQIQTSSFSAKAVEDIEILPDDKILVSGAFNNYNGRTVSNFVRLNADGTLDQAFNNNLFAPQSYPNNILSLPDGKIIVSGLSLTLSGQTQPTKNLLRLNADGTIDATFNYAFSAIPQKLFVDAAGRVYVAGNFQVTENGITFSRALIRLNADGSHDQSFKFEANREVLSLAMQNNKIIVAGSRPNNNLTEYIVYRINDNGSTDNSFPTKVLGNFFIRKLIVQPDNKILSMTDKKIVRLTENGEDDNNFQPFDFPNLPRGLFLNTDGKITAAYGNSPTEGFTVFRLLPDGTTDPTYTNYSYKYGLGGMAMQSNGSVILGDVNPGAGSFLSNGFIRLTQSGAFDTEFVPGGTGFMNVNPGNVRSIAVQTDNKILISGKFDKVGGAFRRSLARLNADSTIDNDFQLNTVNNGGNYFSQIIEILNVKPQTDGKIVVTGAFTYFVNGVEKRNLVRLNSDGSIDPSFVPAINLWDTFLPNGGGSNRFVLQNDGKIVVGTSGTSTQTPSIAYRFNSDGSLDNIFQSQTLAEGNTENIMDLEIQPDGKILLGGRYYNSTKMSFLVRLNADGSLDSTFQVPEQANMEITAIELLEDGKILVAKMEGSSIPSSQKSIVQRLNSDGSIDSSFAVNTPANGRIHTLLVLPDGKIMVGGRFTTFNDQPRVNLLKLNQDGSLDETTYSVNQEVFCLTLDNESRILVGGNFTTISIGDQNVERSFAARIISQQQNGTRFDFDGDGRADHAVFSSETGDWSIFQSDFHKTLNEHFGAKGDRSAAGDFDGDRITDKAVYRPSEGMWYLMQSSAGFGAVRWGAAEDIPVPADFDGDGKDDFAVWRPSTGTWHVLQSSNFKAVAVQFGQAGDYALPSADFDEDGRADYAVFRPSNGTFYWMESRSDYKFKAVKFGAEGDIPSVGDFNGDRIIDLVVFRPSNGVWYQYLSVINGGGYKFEAVQFGLEGDEPVAADYNGDGMTDIAIRRQNEWHLLLSGQGYSGMVFGDLNTHAVAALSK